MSVKFTILGCGSSLGVPRTDGFFGNCNTKIRKNFRTRCSALISTNQLNLLIDTSPDIRTQLLGKKIKNINGVFYTHSHADQTHGINELRAFFLRNRQKIPVYADIITKKILINSFEYCFNNKFDYPAILKMKRLRKLHLYKDIKNKITIRSIKAQHGSIESICYLINNKCLYAPDVNRIYEKDFKYFKNLKYLVIDCLRYKQHPSHYNLDGVLDLVKYINPKKTILTNLSTDIDYSKIKKKLPKNIMPAHDGLSFLI